MLSNNKGRERQKTICTILRFGFSAIGLLYLLVFVGYGFYSRSRDENFFTNMGYIGMAIFFMWGTAITVLSYRIAKQEEKYKAALSERDRAEWLYWKKWAYLTVLFAGLLGCIARFRLFEILIFGSR
jgi:ABC-type uncharacterized transport system permease subunit